MKNFIKYFFLITCSLLSINNIFSQFVPGDVFREYSWYNEFGDAGSALRIGVGLESDYFELNDVEDIILPNNFDLTNAIKAELVVEKLQSHAGTRELKIRINGNAWIPIPESEDIPQNQYEYMHLVYPVISVPLSHLKQGTNNKFRMEVNKSTGSPWAQNIINGLIFRVYYDSSKVDYPKGKILTPAKNDSISENVNITAEASGSNGVKQVDYIGYHEGISYEGDSIYTRWHYHYFHTKIYNHIGTATAPPYAVNWDTEWLPDQEEPIKLMARIVDNTDMIYVTEIVDSIIAVKPENITVKICKPYDVPKAWVTRSAKLSEKINITGDTANLDIVKLIWSSWSPKYENGLEINDLPFSLDGDFPGYKYYVMEFEVNNPEDMFVSGENIIAAPKPDVGSVHGMEILYPGIMALVRYNNKLLPRPYYNLTSKTYNVPQKVYIEAEESGAEIYYTLDGSSPSKASTLFTDSVEIDTSLVLKARTFKTGSDSSHISYLELNFKADRPDVFVHESVDGKIKVTMSMSTEIPGAEIRYNLNSNDNPTSSSTLYEDTILVENNTKIRAIVTKEGWQDGYLRLKTITPSGITLQNYMQGVSVYPNPLQQQLTVEMDNLITGVIQVNVIDVLGKMVKSITINKTATSLVIPIDVSDLVKGIYVLQLNQDNNTYTKKIVK